MHREGLKGRDWEMRTRIQAQRVRWPTQCLYKQLISETHQGYEGCMVEWRRGTGKCLAFIQTHVKTSSPFYQPTWKEKRVQIPVNKRMATIQTTLILLVTQHFWILTSEGLFCQVRLSSLRATYFYLVNVLIYFLPLLYLNIQPPCLSLSIGAIIRGLLMSLGEHLWQSKCSEKQQP